MPKDIPKFNRICAYIQEYIYPMKFYDLVLGVFCLCYLSPEVIKYLLKQW